MSPAFEPGDAEPDSVAVRDALGRIGASEELRASPQLVAFLNFVVEAVLNGHGGRIKAYAIGVEALGRGAGFDPQTDPIVRVEATRLRRAMERYYAGTGAADPIIIDLPRGGYVPRLRFRAARAVPSVPLTSTRAPLPIANGRHRWMLWPVAAALLIAVGVLAPRIRIEWSPNPVATSAGRETKEEAVLRPGNGMPTLVVMPFAVTGGSSSDAVSAAELRDRLRDAFVRFDAINVLSEAAEPSDPDAVSRPARTARAAVDYRLDGSAEYLGGAVANLQFRLIDNREDKLIWTQAFIGVGLARDDPEAGEAVVAKIAATLLPPFGIIHSFQRAKDLSADLTTAAIDPRYRCLLAAVDSFRNYAPNDEGPVRACLERLTMIDPSFTDGFAYLAVSYNREFLFGPAATSAAALDRALAAARRAVELDPANARAYQTLSLVLFYRGASPEWQIAAAKALLLNKYDPTISSLFGGLLVASGEVDKGMTLLHRWDDLTVVRPSWEHFYLFLGNYVRGNIAEATHHAEQITSETFPGGLLARAVLAAHAGNPEQARQYMGKLFALQPSWRATTARELQKFVPATSIVQQIAHDLQAARTQ